MKYLEQFFERFLWLSRSFTIIAVVASILVAVATLIMNTVRDGRAAVVPNG